jgi:hypothetical protein
MKRVLAVFVLLGIAGLTARAQEKNVESRIVSVAMFKNGLAVVERTVDVPGAGTYRVSDVPEPVHGTFWIESDTNVEVRVSTRRVEVPLGTGKSVRFQEDLAGKEVVIHFRDGGIPPASGTVLGAGAGPGEANWDRNYRARSRYSRYARTRPREAEGRFLILKTDEGHVYVDSSLIAYARVKSPGDTAVEERPVLILDVKGAEEQAPTMRVKYLAKGMAWAPSYRVDTSDPDELTIRQKAVIKNELCDIEDAELYLISGFPSVQFAHVTSPLSLRTSWSDFFQELNQRPQQRGHLGVAMQQQAVVHNVAAPDAAIDLTAIPLGEGPDVHYQSIGRRSVAEGDSLALTVGSGSASYERIVEWIVPDTRRADGRHVREHERRRNPERYRDAAWDAIRFSNPLPFPMTTGAAMVVGQEGRFQGQRLSYWVNKGEKATLHVTKALSIRTRSVEHEEPGKREIVYVGGDDYQKTEVEGELSLNNHREETVKVVIRRRFSGELLEADGDPRTVLREEGAWSVNKRNELTWTVHLLPGRERTLTYRYSVLVNR